MQNFDWDDLAFWESGEWQVVEERLKDMEKRRETYNPARANLFRALDITPYESIKVAILGQDPYPDHDLATGVAFSIPANVDNFPPTLNMIFDEYESDLHLPRPTTGCLEVWASRGVLLWNVIPSCEASRSLSHDWDEWSYLTKEIIEKLSEKGCVFVMLGNRAKDYERFIKDLHSKSNNRIIKTSHPSPRGNKFSKSPFIGSRIFSRTNAALREIGLEPIEWRL